jgi:hypothetical protein
VIGLNACSETACEGSKHRVCGSVFCEDIGPTGHCCAAMPSQVRLSCPHHRPTRVRRYPPYQPSTPVHIAYLHGRALAGDKVVSGLDPLGSMLVGHAGLARGPLEKQT